MQIILVNRTSYVAEKCQKITVSFPGKTPLKLKKINVPENQAISIPYQLQAQPALALLLLACYCSSTTMCRQNRNCVNPNQTDS